jgi:hypothetical protein
MAILENLESRARCVLRARHLVGRSAAAHLRLDEPMISGEHAALRWNGRAWEIHDLASRNGTTLDGRRLAPRERATLARGAILGFGKQGNRWQLVDDAAPVVMAVPDAGGEPRLAVDDLLALPDDEHPEVVVYRDRAGEWVAEHLGKSARISDGAHLLAGGHGWALHLPEIAATTWDTDRASLGLEQLTLRFAVTRDEEHVELSAIAGGKSIDLGSRAHLYVLLTLARARLEDRALAAQSGQIGDAAAARSHGWRYQDELATMLDMDDQYLNVAVYRCRRQLAALGVAGTANIIERRMSTRQMRLGIDSIEIVTI